MFQLKPFCTAHCDIWHSKSLNKCLNSSCHSETALAVEESAGRLRRRGTSHKRIPPFGRNDNMREAVGITNRRAVMTRVNKGFLASRHNRSH